ncbi:hypothetical protein L1077_04945 [Pseudoalteromonas luteoviolacea]|uniref:hypothetical protein n=1 Tax=Pseudoalteromonas luteoviolacea TaxID=43657 RepID=UPI001F17D7EA|nr:hypothetical protein [Pseudoalteromonas luteoviolacea]MCF6438777.1 hypothetical protein [Pseudoalteromonas luteoviolacea]
MKFKGKALKSLIDTQIKSIILSSVFMLISSSAYSAVTLSEFIQMSEQFDQANPDYIICYHPRYNMSFSEYLNELIDMGKITQPVADWAKSQGYYPYLGYFFETSSWEVVLSCRVRPYTFTSIN